MRKLRSSSIASVAALLVLAVFSMGILGVLLSGARVYRGLTAQGAEDYDRRTCLQYLTTKLSQAPDPAMLSIERFGAGDALFIRQNIENKSYVTRIYCHNGWLMELFSVDSPGFSPEDGEKLMLLDSLSLTRCGSLLTAAVQKDGKVWQLQYAVGGWGQ